LPSRVSSIGNRTFYGCGNLLVITVDPENKDFSSVDGVLLDKNQTTLVAFPGGRGGGYTIPGTVTDIQEGAFSGCDKLNSIQFPGGVTRIANGAFSGCGSLTQVTFPGSVARIGYGAFYMCGGLTELTFPASLTHIGDGAFYGCSSVKEIYFEGNAPSAGSSVASRLYFEPVPATYYYLPDTTGWESVFPRSRLAPWKPHVRAIRPSAAPESNGFAFTITWARDREVAVEASDSLAQSAWSTIATLLLSGGASEFRDSGWTNSPTRFYRLRAR
jgi:hypothetical protein